jgi:hypothetical protein
MRGQWLRHQQRRSEAPGRCPRFARDCPVFMATYSEQSANFDAGCAIFFNGLSGAANLDMVGVTGSIPVPPTILQ